jgi:O-antigen ligase
MTLKSYQSFIAASAVALFFTNLPSYLFLEEIVPSPPILWMLGIGIAFLPILFLQDPFKIELSQTSLIVIIWCGVYLFISFVWFFPSSQSDIAWQEVRTRILSVLFLLSMLFILNHERAQLWARRVMLIAVLIATTFNVYEFFNPFFFVPIGNEFSHFGRSAGFFVNPNESAAAIVLGMIFGIGLLREKYRMAFALFSFLGILATFSRAGLIVWFISIPLLLKTRVITFARLIQGAVGVVIIILILIPWWDDLILDFEKLGSLYPESVERIEWFSHPSETDFSTNERRDVLKLGWEMFSERPLFGNGTASTLEWKERSSTHNMYLYYMVDHGIIGLFILPFLVFATTWRAQGQARSIGFSFAVIILLFGFFSHNIIGEYYFLLSFSLMAAMTGTSRKNRSPQTPGIPRNSHLDV